MIRVVKVGGSLFDLADLPRRLRHWLSLQSPAHHVLVTGGGVLVEEVRRRHALEPIDEETAHWQCVDLMGVSARSLRLRMPEVPLTNDADRLRAHGAGLRASIFDPGDWLRRCEPRAAGTRLARGWEATSDSIAARLAVWLGAAELVLLKSTLPPADRAATPVDLSATGYVDGFFPQLAAELPPARVVNFRDDSYQEVKIAGCRHLAPL